MAQRAHRSDPDDDEEEDEPLRRLPRSGGGRRSARSGRPSVRRWSDEEEDDEDLPRRHRRSAGEDETVPAGKAPVYFRARDSVYFEPLVAAAIIVVLLAALFAYTQNWPPMYVVESSSMQHGGGDQVGLINTGDLVLAQKVDLSQLTSYERGAQVGYSTYGEYGDVLLYHPNGITSGAPIIHRAILYIVVNPNGSYSFPDLDNQPCGGAANAVYAVSANPSGCGTVGVASGTLELFHVGWRSVTVAVDLASLGGSSGFLTMGDNNVDPANTSLGNPDQPYLSTLVQPGWVLGVARGMLPWFGSVKLLLDGNAAEVPSQSWQFLALTIVGLVLMAFGVHFLLREAGVEDERRKAEEAEARKREGPRSRGGWHWPRPLWGWKEEDDEEEDEDDEEERPRGRHAAREPPPRRSFFGGRPKPVVGRSPRSRSHRRSSDDDEDL